MEDDDPFLWAAEATFYQKKKSVPNKEKKEVKEELYEINDGLFGTRYGIKLAENSQGKWVMEIKGTGAVEAVDPTKVSKVVPYTIAIRFAPKGQTYHYLAKAGDYQIGDFYIVEGYQGGNFQLATVVDINTKSEMATKEFAPIKKIS